MKVPFPVSCLSAGDEPPKLAVLPQFKEPPPGCNAEGVVTCIGLPHIETLDKNLRMLNTYAKNVWAKCRELHPTVAEAHGTP